MTSTAQMRVSWARWRCNESKMDVVSFPGVGRTWELKVADATVPAWNIFAATMSDHNYYFREGTGGTYNCREIGNTGKYSLHSYGLALDLNPKTNPQGRATSDFPPAFITDVGRIKTGNGKQVFRWGIIFAPPDPMHWEINVSPADLATGIQGGIVAWTSKDGYTYQETDWAPHGTGIKWVIDAGLMVGKRNPATMTGDFNAAGSLSRREFATVTLRLATDASIKDEIDD